jgi:hypothetical protein
VLLQRDDLIMLESADQGVGCVKVYNSAKEPELKEIIRTARARKLIPKALPTGALVLTFGERKRAASATYDRSAIRDVKMKDVITFLARTESLWSYCGVLGH